MKIKSICIVIMSAGLLSFIFKSDIKNCYISYKGSKKLAAATSERLPAASAKPRMVKTSKGEVEVSRTDGYRILYRNDKDAEFVNLKVELSDPKSYGTDTVNILENLKYLNSAQAGMETKGLMQLSFNGYNIYGLSRSTIDKGSTLGIFVIFPGNNTIVYVYFNNLSPELRHFENVSEYQSSRNGFLGNYTYHINNCR